MIVYALFNHFEKAVVAVVSRKDVADRWHEQTPEFHEVLNVEGPIHRERPIRGHTVDDLMDIVDAFLRDVSAGGGD